MTGEALRRLPLTGLPWGDKKHFDRTPAGSAPCRCGDGPTRMRDEQGEPCHLGCAEKERARLVAVERFGTAEQLAAELIGRPAPATTTRGDL
jgi:hypothetical protein